MRIPIDDNTIGYVTEVGFTEGWIRYEFNKYVKHLHNDKILLTYKQFKEEFNTNSTETIRQDMTWKDISELHELAKTFVFKIPNK